MRLADVASTGPVALLDSGVLRDIASSLSGLWLPATELDHTRTREMVAAARLRLYADRDRCGWYLLTTRASAAAAMRRANADWTVGMLAIAEDFDDAPPDAELAALAELLRRDEGLTRDAAGSLAAGVLFEPITLIVTREPRSFRHGRAGDLPQRLEVVDPVEAVDRLELASGEPPPVSLPAGSMLERGTPWWVMG